ncbi:MAG TPA: hypothetical protein VMR06_02385 [Dokdonella sp.]|uniref:hypothetical protein n=1 Tax=Dokdonella sp. TaxID=2291710 RepID=UPI002CEA241D|nr:hypothetical protein [Dokdonella sp.]HUD40824.1 hypothetical protein [Dokdonella sp.]
MKTLPLIGAVLFALAGVSAASDSQARERSRSVERDAHGGQVSASRSNARFDAQRQRRWQTDGHGQASIERDARIEGAGGGSAARTAGAWRNADGSAGRYRSASMAGPRGGSATTAGAITRGADGSVAGGRSTSATGPNGGTYTGSTTLVDGSVQHSHSCSDAAGQPVACRR